MLSQNLHLLPVAGQALDLACGLGGNALLLAQHGLAVTAWDLSPVAVNRLRQSAEGLGLQGLTAEVRDLERRPPPPDCFDLIIVSYFLERSLAPYLVASLKPGGLLFYQTYTRFEVSKRGPENPLYRLDENELLVLFRPLSVRYYREEQRLGDTTKGARAVAMLIAEKVRVRS